MITFPTTPEAFIAHQEQLAGRELTGKRRELVAAWAKVFNLSYKDGLKQDRDALEDSLAKMDELMARRDESPEGREFLMKCSMWIVVAWKQGNRESADCMCSG